MTEDGPGLIRGGLKDSSQVDLVVFRQMDRISTPTFFLRSVVFQRRC